MTKAIPADARAVGQTASDNEEKLTSRMVDPEPRIARGPLLWLAVVIHLVATPLPATRVATRRSPFDSCRCTHTKDRAATDISGDSTSVGFVSASYTAVDLVHRLLKGANSFAVEGSAR